MTQLYKFFPADELACHCGCGKGEAEMDPGFMQTVIHMREEAGFPFVLSSAFRCPAHNAKVSKTGLTGPHTTGHAVDIRCFGARAKTVIRLSCEWDMSGLGINQKGIHNIRFIHVDNLKDGLGVPRPYVWGY